MKKSYRLEYNKIKECEILFFGDELKFWSFLKMKHWICKESVHFLKFIFIQLWLKNKMWFIGENSNIFKNKLQKKNSKIHLHVKVLFGKIDVQSFSKVIPLAPSDRFWSKR